MIMFWLILRPLLVGDVYAYEPLNFGDLLLKGESHSCIFYYQKALFMLCHVINQRPCKGQIV